MPARRCSSSPAIWPMPAAGGVAVADRCRPLPGRGDIFLDRLGRKVLLHRHDLREVGELGHRHPGRWVVERQVLDQERVCHLVGGVDQEGLAVARRMQHRAGRDQRIAAGAIVDDDLLAQDLRHPRADIGVPPCRRLLPRRRPRPSGCGPLGHSVWAKPDAARSGAARPPARRLRRESLLTTPVPAAQARPRGRARRAPPAGHCRNRCAGG